MTETQADLFDFAPRRLPFGVQAPADARARRDIGIALVTTSNVDWTFRTREAFRTWLAAQPPDREWIAEDFRSHLDARNWIAPSHPNAWGALFGWIARSGLVVDAGRLERMTQPRSHARRSPVYRKA